MMPDVIGTRLRDQIETNLALNPGMPPERVAERLHCTVDAVLAVWEDMDRINAGLEPLRREKPTTDPDEAAVLQWMAGEIPGDHRWTVERLEAARRLSQQGWTSPQIAQQLHSHPDQIKKMLNGERTVPVRSTVVCGTIAGYNRHRREGSRVCPACRAVAREQRKQTRKRVQCPHCQRTLVDKLNRHVRLKHPEASAA